MAHSIVCLPLSHLATEDGRHYASLSVCLRRHLLSLGQLFALAALPSSLKLRRDKPLSPHLFGAESQFLRARFAPLRILWSFIRKGKRILSLE